MTMILFKDSALIALFKQRLIIRDKYKTGIGQPFFLLRYSLPIISLILFLLIIDYLSLSKNDFLDLIKQLNSLVGIILGFSIASFAIFISISNDKLENESKQSKYTYREIGSSLFFYNVEVALFTSLIGIIILYLNIPIFHMNDFIELLTSDDFKISLLFSTKGIKFSLYIIYLLLFFQLIFNLFYSSIFLNSSIKK